MPTTDAVSLGPISRENAAEYARRATASRQANKAARANGMVTNGSSTHIRSELERDLERTLRELRSRRDTFDNDELMAATRLYAQLTGMIKAQAPADSDATEDRLAQAYERAGLDRPQRLQKRRS